MFFGVMGYFLRKFYLGILDLCCPLGFAVEAEKTREF